MLPLMLYYVHQLVGDISMLFRAGHMLYSGFSNYFLRKAASCSWKHHQESSEITRTKSNKSWAIVPLSRNGEESFKQLLATDLDVDPSHNVTIHKTNLW